ncbi:MAG: redoxin domain-containing protein [Planctomycetes bacterium]|nr:redoxin domain-containing protein [Planctomycetota bacterium]
MERTTNRRCVHGLLALLALAACVGTRDGRSTATGTPRRVAVRGSGAVAGKDQVGEWTYLHENGQVKARGGYVADRQEGLWTWFHDNGNQEMEGQVRDDRREGLWRYHHRNGNPRALGSFWRGREEGPWSFWNSDGQLVEQGDYSDGRPAGRWVSFGANGQKRAEGAWLDGHRVGEWRFWDDAGQPFVKSFALPAATIVVRETFADGKPRRDGFLRDTLPVGRFTTYHHNGRRRASGEFVDGSAHGPWMAWDAAGERLALGTVDHGRPSGEWTVWRNGQPATVRFDAVTPPPPALAEWSDDLLPQREPPEVVATLWLAEAAAEIERPVAPAAEPAAPAPPLAAAPPPALEQEAATPLAVPVKAQPYTQREEEEYDRYVENYGLAPRSNSSTGGRYGRPRAAGSVANGDEERAAKLVGQPLAVDAFRCADGRQLRIEDFRGKQLLMVVLRGYGSGICVYCDAQTRALSAPETAQAIAALGCQVVLVYPGPENGWEAFLEKYQRAGDDAPPYPCLFDPELRLVRSLGIEGTQAIPSSLLLDASGVVRYAYVGTTVDDRPSAKRLVEEIRKL